MSKKNWLIALLLAWPLAALAENQAQLEAAVMDITRMRADGKGWGQIAEAKGFKLGEVKRPDHVARAERPEKPEKPEKPERPEKPQRPK